MEPPPDVHHSISFGIFSVAQELYSLSYHRYSLERDPLKLPPSLILNQLYGCGIPGRTRAKAWPALVPDGRVTDRLPNLCQPRSTHHAQGLCAHGPLFAHDSQQQMFGANVSVAHSLRLFRRIRKHTFAFVREWQLNRSRYFLSNGRVT